MFFVLTDSINLKFPDSPLNLKIEIYKVSLPLIGSENALADQINEKYGKFVIYHEAVCVTGFYIDLL